MNSNKDIIQFKLSSSAEILCEVLEWNDANDLSSTLIIKNAMSVIFWDHENGERSYVFRPWISFPDEQTDFVIINPEHIIAMNRPGKYLLDQYEYSVNEALENSKKRDASFFEDINRNNLKKFSNLLKEIANLTSADDEEEKPISNVIQFPDPDKIH